MKRSFVAFLLFVIVVIRFLIDQLKWRDHTSSRTVCPCHLLRSHICGVSLTIEVAFTAY